MKKLAIFDFDGTLGNSVPGIALSGNETLKKLGLSEHSEDYYRNAIGEGMMKLLERILPPEAPESLFIKAKDLFVEIYSVNCDKDIHIYPGIHDMLKALKAAGIKTAVLSNKPHAFTVRSTDKYFKGCFDLVLGQRNDIPKKPEPDGVFEIMRQLKISPEDAAYIGDAPVDILTARKAGIASIAVSWGMRPLKELVESRPDRIIHQANQLKDCLLNP